MSVATA